MVYYHLVGVFLSYLTIIFRFPSILLSAVNACIPFLGIHLNELQCFLVQGTY